MSRSKILFAFVCALLFFPLEAAYACGPGQPSVRVTCMDGQSDSIWTGIYGENKAYDVNTSDIIDLAISLCATDLSAGYTQINRLADE